MNSTTELDATAENLWFPPYVYEGVLLFTTIAYIVIPACVVIGNLALLIPVVKYVAFRQRPEYVALMGVFFADLLNNLAYIMAGIYRTWRVAVGGPNNNSFGFTGVDCLFMPFNLIWSFAYPTAGVMLCVTSLERLVSMAAPMWHIHNGVNVAKCLVGLVCIHGLVFSVLANISGLDRDFLVDSDQCYQMDTISKSMYGYEMNINSYGSIASVLIYSLVVVLYIRYNAKNKTSGSNRTNAAAEAQQKAMTKNLAKSTLATLILVVLMQKLALELINAGRSNKPWAVHKVFVNLLYNVPLLNPLLNIWWFVVRNQHVRKGCSKALRGQSMPANLTAWQITKVNAITPQT